VYTADNFWYTRRYEYNKVEGSSTGKSRSVIVVVDEESQLYKYVTPTLH